MSTATFDGFTFNHFKFNPNPRAMFDKTEDIERTDLNGIEVKYYGKRPIEYQAETVFQEVSADAMYTKIIDLLTHEKHIATLRYENHDFTNVELFRVTPLDRRTSPQGPVQRLALTFRPVR